MTDLDVQIPEFTVALRGYDRLQVDGYIDRLQSLLEDTEERLRAAEPGDHHYEVGPRISQIFDLATAEAQDIRDSAERDARQLLQTAHRDANAVVQERQAEWEAKLGGYRAEREQIQQEIDELRAQKAWVLEDVRRLHDALGAAAGAPSPAPAPAELDESPETAVEESAASEAETQPNVRLLDEPDPDATREFSIPDLDDLDLRDAG